jgi:hypothetical protein
MVFGEERRIVVVVVFEKEELFEGSKVTGAEVEELKRGASATSASERITGESDEGVFSVVREGSGVADLTIVKGRSKGSKSYRD